MSDTTVQQNGVLDTDAWIAEAVAQGKKLRDEYAAHLEEEKRRIAQRKRKDHLCNCGDCGKFLPKERWLPKLTRANEQVRRPLCHNCWQEYDF